MLVSHGIKGFWNFSHYDLAIDYDDIAVENVHLGDSLSILCYRVHELENSDEGAPAKNRASSKNGKKRGFFLDKYTQKQYNVFCVMSTGYSAVW